MSENISHRRRDLVSLAAATLAAAQFGGIGPSRGEARSDKAPPTVRASAFAALKQIEAGLLDVGYAEAGPPDGPAVILLHGWPYDIHSFVEVTPLLAQAGYRVIAPYLRGYGTTHFLSNETFRNGQPAAIAADIVSLMDALKIERATLAGFDWGARTANIIAAAFPARCRAMVSVSGYLISSQESAGPRCLHPQNFSGGTSSTLRPTGVGQATRNIAAISRS